MDFIVGGTYQNASGRFRVLSVDASTLKLEYESGPQAGRVLIKRTVDMGRLSTTPIDAANPAPADAAPPRRSRGSSTAPKGP